MAVFDKRAPSYQAWYEADRGRAIDQLESECALSLYRPGTGDLVIDIGCGTGNFSRKLIDLGARIVGIDASQLMLDQAMQQDDQSIYRVMDMHELDYPDHYFDAAVSAFALEFTDRAEQVIQEAFRVVKPGGHILMGTIARDSAYGQYYIQRGREGHPLFENAHFYSLEELLQVNPEQVVDYAQCIGFGPDDPVIPDCPPDVVPGVFFIHWIK